MKCRTKKAALTRRTAARVTRSAPESIERDELRRAVIASLEHRPTAVVEGAGRGDEEHISISKPTSVKRRRSSSPEPRQHVPFMAEENDSPDRSHSTTLSNDKFSSDISDLDDAARPSPRLCGIEVDGRRMLPGDLLDDTNASVDSFDELAEVDVSGDDDAGSPRALYETTHLVHSDSPVCAAARLLLLTDPAAYMVEGETGPSDHLGGFRAESRRVSLLRRPAQRYFSLPEPPEFLPKAEEEAYSGLAMPSVSSPEKTSESGKALDEQAEESAVPALFPFHDQQSTEAAKWENRPWCGGVFDYISPKTVQKLQMCFLERVSTKL